MIAITFTERKANKKKKLRKDKLKAAQQNIIQSLKENNSISPKEEI
jgi:hypothetical protein